MALTFSLLAATAISCRAAASAPPPPATSLTVMAERELRFGTMVVIDSGSRTVHASGEVTNDTVFPMGYSGTGPAEFSIAYDRGVEDTHPISVVLQITLASIPPVTQGGLEGGLSAFETDIPGIEHLEPGRPVTTTIANCTTRVCSMSFRVGARLDVTRASGGGAFSISPPITATVLAVEG